jgi:hypothetical protein
MKIAVACASLGAPDMGRDLAWPWQLEQRARMLGARGLVVDNCGRDGQGFFRARTEIDYDGDSKRGWNAICEIGTNGFPDIVLVSGDLAWNDAMTFADRGMATSFDIQCADAKAFHDAVAGFSPTSKQVYLPVIPPAEWKYNGVSYGADARAAWQALDDYCKTLWPQCITIDYANYAHVLGAIDGIHGMFGASVFWAIDVAWGLHGLGFDLGIQSPNYPPYDGSGGSAPMLDNIRQRNALGLALISSLNLRLT